MALKDWELDFKPIKGFGDWARIVYNKPRGFFREYILNEEKNYHVEIDKMGRKTHTVITPDGYNYYNTRKEAIQSAKRYMRSH